VSLSVTNPESLRIGDCRIVRELGRGAMGTVFLAHDEVLERAVAIKVLTTSWGARDRVLREARTAARLSHPNVASVYAVGEHEGRPYIVSELVRGTPLDALSLPLLPSRLLEVGVGLARGLAAAHRAGVLHRDVKPANAIVGDDGEVKLVDFGVATLEGDADAGGGAPPRRDFPSATVTYDPLEEGASASRSKRAVGTPVYMAPEVWAGEPATRRSDVYALGAVLYELASGAPPHLAETVTALGARVQETDAPPLVRDGLPPALRELVMCCLARDPARRPSSAEVVRESLETLLASLHTPKSHVPAGNPYRGLEPFDAEHRALFFGRASDVRTVVDRLRGEPFVVVAGDSGVGKSSLCRAGVIPAIESGALGRATARTLTLSPGRRPATSLAVALSRSLDLAEGELAELMASEPRELARRVRKSVGTEASLIVFVDQLEELVTESEPAEARVFVAALADLVASASGGVRVLATVRGDFVTRVARMLARDVAFERALVLLGPLDEGGLRAAIVEPARAKGYSFDPPELVEILVRVTEASAPLPLLQFALAALWEARDAEARTILGSALDALGGVDGALARHADAVLASMLPGPRHASRHVLSALVTAEGTRAQRSEPELTGGDAERRAALDALVRGRLVVARADASEPTYELAHDALVGAWATLREILADDEEKRFAAERISRAASEWERLGRSRDALFGDKQLAESAALDREALPEKARTFLAESERVRTRKRWTRRAVVVAVPVTLAAVGLGVRLDARRKIDARASQEVARAQEEAARARAEQRDAEALAKDAFERFDRHEGPPAEAAWDLVLARRTDVERSFGRAARAAETAVLLAPERADARALLADLLQARALLADDGRHAEVLGELRERLTLYDVDGSRRAAWDRPATLTVRIANAVDARVSLERFVDDAPAHWERVDVDLAPGRTAPLERGSYRVHVEAPGREAVIHPVLLGRGEALEVDLALPRRGAVPAGFVLVEAGRFMTGTAEEHDVRKDVLRAAPLHTATTAAYLIARTETTYGEWIAWLDTLPREERNRRRPHASSVGLQGDVELRETASGWQLRLQPGTRALTASAREPIRYPRDRNAIQDWLRMPVTGVSYEDARAYAAWLDGTGRVPHARLCREEEWERAARGADGRVYPHGRRVSGNDVNHQLAYGPEADAHGPDEVGMHPASESPYGLADAAGNVFELVTTQGEDARLSIVRGGAFAFEAAATRTELREVVEPGLRDITIGVRLCADPPRFD